MIKFGTGGFRSVIGEDFNKNSIQKIAQSLAKIIKTEKSDKPVLIGYDRRFMSDVFAKWFAEVLAGNKIAVRLYETPVPTPCVMFGVMDENLDYGITITASHNPYFYNGIKISKKGGIDADIEFTTQIEKMANKNIKIKTLDFDIAKKQNLIISFDNTKKYMKNIFKFVSKDVKNNSIKVLFDPMHGVTVDCAKILADKFAINKFTMINENIDPYFAFITPSPDEKSMETFRKEVVKGKYTVGLAADADGDRLGVVDELGEYHGCNIVMSIIYYYLVKYRNLKGDIVKNQSTSYILDLLAQKFGSICHHVPVGFKWVSAKMKETNALVGGESSGGLTVRDYVPCKDSMFAIALLLDAIIIINKPLSKIVKKVKDYCGYISTYVEGTLQIKNKKKLIKTIAKELPRFSYKPVDVLREDGAKYIFEDNSWIHIRFSGTEDLIRYHLEFQTEIECERNLQAIKNFITQYE